MGGELSRRAFVVAAVLVAFTTLIGACAPKDRASDAGSTLRIAYFTEDAMGPSWDMHGKLLVFLPLVTLDSLGDPSPRLARSWEHTPDWRTWTVRLRNDVRWHDGVRVTAHDVAFTLDLMRHPDVGKAPPDAYRVEVLDDSTYRITNRGGRVGTPLDDWTVYYPKHLLERLAPADFYKWEFWREPVGNGPYRFSRRVAGQMMEFEANPDFFAGRPRIARVMLRFGVGEEQPLPELLAGNVDVLPYFSSMRLPEIARDPRFIAYRGEGSSYNKGIVWNQRNPLFAPAAMRRALTLAIDRRALYRGLNSPGEPTIFDVIYTPRQFRRGELPPPLRFDTAEAVALLERAGWKDTDGDGIRDRGGRRFRFTLLTTNAEAGDRIAVLVQAQLRRIGVHADLQVVHSSVLDERVRDGDFEAAISRRFPGGQERGPIRYFGQQSPIGYHAPEVVAALQAADTTVDPAAVDALYRRTWPVLRADLPITFIPLGGVVTVAHRRVHGIDRDHIDPTGSAELLWIDRHWRGKLRREDHRP